METLRRSSVMRWFSSAALAATCALVLTGCSLGGQQEQQTHVAEPATVVSVLPARPGLTPAGPIRAVDAQGFTTALLGHPDSTLTTNLEQAGFLRGATREWTGPKGASLVAVVGLWDDGSAAASLGGDAADASAPGGTPWTPSQYGGSQGARADNARALSVVVGRVSLFLRATGPVDDTAVLRQMDLMFQTASGMDRQGTSSNG